MPGTILICAAAIMSAGLRAALCAAMPDLDYRLCRNEIAVNIEAFARQVSEMHPQMTILDADSVPIRDILEALGKRTLAPFKAGSGFGLLGKIVVLTTRPNEEDLYALAMHGARAYVSGCLPTDELTDLVRKLLANDDLYLLDSRTLDDPYLAMVAEQRKQRPRVVETVIDEMPAPVEMLQAEAHTPDPELTLTEQELRMLRALAYGMELKVAARHAEVSYFLGKKIVRDLEHRLERWNHPSLVVRAWQLKLIDLPSDEMLFHYSGRHLIIPGTNRRRDAGLKPEPKAHNGAGVPAAAHQ